MRPPLDGNAAAGELAEVFALEMTAAKSCCRDCGPISMVGALAAYMDAPGVVLRCSACQAVILRLVRGSDRMWLDVRGARYLEFPAGAP
jgi:hypothetical protein